MILSIKVMLLFIRTKLARMAGRELYKIIDLTNIWR